MADMLASGLVWLEDQRTRHASETVTYRRGTQSAQVSATKGRSEFETVSARDVGVVERIESTDWIILTADLTDFGDPRRGDRIEEVGTDGHTWVYEVVPFGVIGGQSHWRFSDSHRNSVRIHSKHIKTKDPA